ncbi:SDR family NAD(P)-dependent oxidoreductase [Tenuifilum sp.]|uniref:SDR family NAD(P)-dependent oxidoreductase n=1 Tax=Tenuifilum sp. TaxID=2760880 RepID=UPI002CBE7466|nr:SDR family NAD(P)-dependent oxidoreductase [Tenuifilum sp.]HQE55459.1 SDR family NAD(P)-dependent oxidoreductase [Tenuifilum sp.]HQG73461.1 SDR family NAD(P)-dependent oxidoreductase [Tenuifilum sp.]HQI89794.1 SDR family NAD(P)-dependent oxidoreductase [Tenuifilum sp.]HRR12353.1 SDR family NAD(P)-dependent oxidoreductase [Tenuifilum sp.]
MMRIALITGATSGIGRATALRLAMDEFNLIITGRRLERLEELKKEIEVKYKKDVHILNFDIRNLDEVNSAIDSLPERWRKIDVLVNNAGLAVGLNHIQDGVIDDWERMIDTNIKGVLYITRKVAPMMIERGKGHIVNIGSIAGTQVYENGNVYCSTKHAMHALSQGMRQDMLKHNIKVTEIRPGLLETEFSIVRFKGDSEKAKNTYVGLTPLFAEDIADAIHFVLTRPPHVCINDLEVTPVAQANAYYVNRNV